MDKIGLKGQETEATGKGLAICKNGRGYCLTDKISPNHLLIVIKVDPHQLSIISQVHVYILLHSFSQSDYLLEFYELLEMFTLKYLEKYRD